MGSEEAGHTVTRGTVTFFPPSAAPASVGRTQGRHHTLALTTVKGVSLLFLKPVPQVT